MTGGEVTALCPLSSDAGDELQPAEDQRVHGCQSDVHSEEHKKSLILFSDTVVHPRAVMVHFPNTSFANAAVVGALRLDAAALGALVDHLSGLQLQALHVLFSSVSFGYRPGVGEHGPQVRRQGEHRQAVEDHPVDHGVPEVLEGSSMTNVTTKSAYTTSSQVSTAQIMPQPSRMNHTLSAASASAGEEAAES